MENEVWSLYDHRTGNEATLISTEGSQYNLVIQNPIAGTAASMDLDRKNLKDMFNDIGNEIGAF